MEKWDKFLNSSLLLCGWNLCDKQLERKNVKNVVKYAAILKRGGCGSNCFLTAFNEIFRLESL